MSEENFAGTGARRGAEGVTRALFYVAEAFRCTYMAMGERALPEVETQALEVANRALKFISDNMELRKKVAEAQVQQIAEGADHV